MKIPTEIALIKNDIHTANLDIQTACDVMDCLIDGLETGMNKHKHFDGYIEEYIARARWAVRKLFNDTNVIDQAIREIKEVDDEH